jgi:hypothetical protein
VKQQYLLQAIGFLVLVLALAGCQGQAATPTTAQATATHTPSPTSTVTPEPTATPTTAAARAPGRPLLMAHFMPWYQSPEVSGNWGWHWTMDHFTPSRQDENGRREIASHYTPLTGPYDSQDEAILEYQVLLMRASGIDGVIVDWYGAEHYWDYAILDESTHKLFEYVKKACLRFAICYEDQTIMHMVDNKHLDVKDVYTHGQDVMRTMQDNWFGDDAYLRAFDRPVLLIFGPQYFKSAADWTQLFSVLDPPPAFITLDRHTESAAMSSYPWPPMWASKDGVLTQEALEDYLAGFYKKAEGWEYLVAGAFPAFHDIYEEAGVSPSYGYLDPQLGETFRLTLQLALDANPDVIQLITWNDYGEGTIIEPTEEFGYRYLEMVQSTRRATDNEPFPFDVEDLELPLRLYDLRKQYAKDAQVNAQLDQAFEAILSGEPDVAAGILDSYSETP